MSWFVGFDFDGTLHRNGEPIHEVIDIMRDRAAAGDMPVIVTARTGVHELPSWYAVNEPDRILLWPFVERYELPIHGVIFCGHERKSGFLCRCGIIEHYDNTLSIIDDLNNDPGSITRGYLVGDVIR